MNATVRPARAEVRKLFTTRAVPVTAAIAAVLAVGSVLINAAVAAINRRTAEQALTLIRVDYDPLSAVVGMDAARSDGAPPVYRGSTVVFEKRKLPVSVTIAT